MSRLVETPVSIEGKLSLLSACHQQIRQANSVIDDAESEIKVAKKNRSDAESVIWGIKRELRDQLERHGMSTASGSGFTANLVSNDDQYEPGEYRDPDAPKFRIEIVEHT